MILCDKKELEPVLLPLFCSMYWLRLVYSLHGERWLGPYLLPIISAVRDTGPFFFVTSLCIAGATHAYVIMNPRGEDEYPIYSSFLHTVRLAIFGDFDMFEYQGQDTTFQLVENEWVPNDPSPTDLGWYRDILYGLYGPYISLQLCFFCTGIGITVLLMLIAILGQNYEMHQGRAQVLFMQARARMLLEMVMEPAFRRQRAHYQKDIFDRFMQKVWRVLCPVSKHPLLRFGILIVCLVLLLTSFMGLLIYVLMGAIGFTGIRYTINSSFFGLFGDRFAEECEIFALVRTDAASDDLRSMRNDLKDLRDIVITLCRDPATSLRTRMQELLPPRK
ncbi:unnamed protein product [Symbiodinium sp. CCMP2592]|nr:unnamed protein product [Symbiodinium sp. CCMP2592]